MPTQKRPCIFLSLKFAIAVQIVKNIELGKFVSFKFQKIQFILQLEAPSISDQPHTIELYENVSSTLVDDYETLPE